MTRSRDAEGTRSANPHTFRILLWAAAILVLLWAWFDPRFRDLEGALRDTWTMPLALAASLAVLGATHSGEWKTTGRWIGVGLIGQAVVLQLIRAGPVVGYQHYQNPLAGLAGWRVLLVVWLGLQTLAVTMGLRTRWATLRYWLTRHFARWQILAIGTLLVLTSAALSRAVHTYAGELLFATFLQVLNVGTIVLAGWSMPEHGVDKVLSRIGLGGTARPNGRGRVDRFVLVVAAGTLVVTTALTILSYQRHPHVPDEVAYLIQASYFAAGKLWLAAPPVPEAFSVDLLYFGPEKVYSIFPPGWPAILALGVLLGAPWIVNPVLAALNIVLAYLFLEELYDRRTARFGVLLLAASPWSILLGMSFMAHTFTLTCALAAALGIMASRKTGRVVFACMAGAAIGVISLVRPLDALVVAALLGLWSIGLGGKRLSIPAIVGMIMAAGAGGLANLWYNRALTGAARVFPVMEYFDAYYGPKTNALGFGPERGVGWSGLDPFPGHGLLDVAVNANFNLFATNIELFGWATGSLLLVFLVVFSRRMSRSDHLLMTCALAVVAIHSFYWFSGGPDFGARYWYLILVPGIGLTARGAAILAERLEGSVPYQRVSLGILSLCLMALVTFVPWRAMNKYFHYRGMRPDIRSLAHTVHFGRSLVLIQGERHPDYHSAAVYNVMDPQADAPIYAWDRNPEVRDALLRQFQSLPVWLVAGPSRTGGAYRVIQGPVAASELISTTE